jgi:UDP-N-acetylmuramoyl-tripeptide--D-alanyl-D-alanine ligase
MVELVTDEAKYNREFGEYMADCVDIALLVGKKHTEPIREGLLSKGFDAENIHSFNTLDEAVAALKTMTAEGDTVMYENDLPDSYAEGE